MVFHLRVRDKWGVGDSVGGNGLISLGPERVDRRPSPLSPNITPENEMTFCGLGN